MKPYIRIARTFADALTRRDFERASSLLAPELKQELGPGGVEQLFSEMLPGWARDAACSADDPMEMSLEDWPGKLPEDVGLVYVEIIGDNFVEALTITVGDFDGALLIREIEWGRP